MTKQPDWLKQAVRNQAVYKGTPLTSKTQAQLDAEARAEELYAALRKGPIGPTGYRRRRR